MKYKLKLTNTCKNNLKKLSSKEKELFLKIVEKLANEQQLEIKYKDHALKGKYKGCRECHLKPDLLLIYKIEKNELILKCLDIGSHSSLNLC